MDQLEGKWQQIKGQVRQKWGELTNDDLTAIKGRKDKLVGKIQERYGCSVEQANRELRDFMDSCECEDETGATRSKH